MTIQEILEAHVIEVGRNVFTREEWLRCKCGWFGARVLAEGFDWEPAKRDHVADVIAEHMHERILSWQEHAYLVGYAQANEDIENGAEYPTPNPYANKETPNGR